MKFIVSGATGFIGSEVIQQCLNNPSITSVIALSRRPLPEFVARHEKLKVIILEDFTTYTEDILRELAGAEAAIWCLGIPFPTLEESKLVNRDYTFAAADNFAKALAPRVPGGKAFRFVYLSGRLPEADHTKPLFFLQEKRRLRGGVETELLRQKTATFETFVAKPGVVMSKDNWIGNALNFGQFLAIKVDALAAGLISTAVEGGSLRTLRNYDLIERGELLNVSQKA